MISPRLFRLIGTTALCGAMVATIASFSSSSERTRECLASGRSSPPTDVSRTFIRAGLGEYLARRGSGVHNGVDIVATGSHRDNRATEVLAVRDGKIAYARLNGSDTGGYGNTVVVDHYDGTYTLYSHLSMERPASSSSNLLVSVGDVVCAGQLLGHFRKVSEDFDAGSTGNAVRLPAHLSYQVHVAFFRAPSGRSSAGKISDLMIDSGAWYDPTSFMREHGLATKKLD